MNTNKWLFLLFTLCATLANAGARINQEVYVFVPPGYGWGMAGGSIAGAYNSADSNQQISCDYRLDRHGYSDESYTVSCMAINSAGFQGYCRFYYPSGYVLDMLRSITDTSLIEFAWDTSTGLCTGLLVRQSSLQIPRNSSLSALDAKTVVPSLQEVMARHEQWSFGK